MNSLRAEDLSVRLGGREVLRRVSCVLAAGRVTALLGPNGAGKSTLLKAFLGLVPVAHGAVFCGKRPLAALAEDERARLLAYVPQASQLAFPLSVIEVVRQGRFPHRGWGGLSRRDHAVVDDALASADITGLAERCFTQLSSGEVRRVLLARALATEAPALLLDEPTANLDVGHALALLALLRGLAAQGRVVVVALQDLDEARNWADEAVLLAAGEVRCQDAVAAVVAPDPIAAVYGVRIIPGGGFGYRLADD